MTQTKKNKSTVKHEIVEEFDRICDENYALNKVNKRLIKLASDNPFLEGNKPPSDHLIPEKILEKPGLIKDLH